MNCIKCGKDNPPDNRFCDNCGADLTTSVAPPTFSGGLGNECPACKHQNPSGSTFCENCGASMQNASATQTPSQPTFAPQPTVAPPATIAPQPTLQADKFLVLPDGSEIPIQGSKSLGRLDLAKYAAASEVMWISRQHFDLFEENGTPYIIDEKSANGTKVNGKEIKQQGKQQLKNGDEIIVGDAVKLVFKTKSP
jgi:hypothetical protein